MKLIHTLLFLIRENMLDQDLAIAKTCLKSLEKSTYKTVVVYNQGFWDKETLEDYLKQFALNCIVVGTGINTGTVVGRQGCFTTIWERYPDTEYISELHLDMILTHNWEDPLIAYLDNNDEPIISCGIVDQSGNLNFLNKAVTPVIQQSKIIHAGGDDDGDVYDEYLVGLRQDVVVHGFTNPCIHKSSILQCTGGYNPRFLTGKQAFEDDSMLLGYFYYYGTKVNWRPKVCYKSVVYHAVAGQRLDLRDSVMINYYGLIKQYGAMGLKHLSQLHKSQWHINYFSEQYNNM